MIDLHARRPRAQVSAQALIMAALGLMVSSTALVAVGETEDAKISQVEDVSTALREMEREHVSTAAGTDSVTAEATKVASVEGITEYQLSNGLRFLLFPDQSNQQITVNVTYLVGSRHEGYGETGMAHLLEHLVFKGTPKYPDITDSLTKHGARPNGTTSYDRTNYFETFPASEENLAWALDLESDRMVNSFISADDLESEMTVVRNEWERGENSPSSVLSKRIGSVAFMWHNYGKSIIGARADIENVPIERLQAFYRKYYQPDNAILVIAGRFDEEKAIELVKSTFGRIPRPDRSGSNFLFPTYTAEPAQDGERTVTLRRVGENQIAVAAYHIPAGSDPDFAAVYVMAYVLGHPVAGRLHANLVKTGLAARASAFASQRNEPGLMTASAVVRAGNSLDEATAAMLTTIDEMKSAPPSEEEVERAIRDRLTQWELSFNNPQAIALQMTNWMAIGDWRLMFLFRDNLEKVTPDDVLRVANDFLIDSNRTMGYFLPSEETPPRAEVRPKPDVAALVQDYKGREAIAEGEAFEPTLANIEARTREVRLENGLQVFFLPKQNRGDTVTVSWSFPHGDVETLTGKTGVGSMTGAMLMRGTENRTRQEVFDEMDRIKSSIQVGGSARESSGALFTTRDNLSEALTLVQEIVHQPAFDAEELKVAIESSLANLESNKNDPQFLSSLRLQRHLRPYPKGHPNYWRTLQDRIDDLNSLSTESLREFWSTYYGSSNGAMAVVGDFDPDEVTPILEKVFGQWTSNVPYERIAVEHFDQDPLFADIETPDKTNAVLYASITLPIGKDHPDYAAMYLANFMIGGGFLNSRLADRIRQKEGLSYGVRSSYSTFLPDAVSEFRAYAIFAPENADRVLTALREELAKVRESGFSEEEVAAAKNGYLESMKRSRGEDSTIASILVSSVVVDRSIEDLMKFEEAIEALTAEQVSDAAARHIDENALSIVRGGDFARVTQTSMVIEDRED